MSTLYQKYLLADRLSKVAERAGVTVQLIKLSDTAPYFKNVHLQVGIAGDYTNEAHERAAVQLLDAMPELQLRRSDGLIFLEGETDEGLTYQFYTGTGVCKKVQTGTRTVKRPDPAYIDAAPYVEVEEPVFEVICA